MWAGGQFLTDHRPYAKLHALLRTNSHNHFAERKEGGDKESAAQSCPVSEREIEQTGRKRPIAARNHRRKSERLEKIAGATRGGMLHPC